MGDESVFQVGLINLSSVRLGWQRQKDLIIPAPHAATGGGMHGNHGLRFEPITNRISRNRM